MSGNAPWQKSIDAAAQTEPYSANKGIIGNAKAALSNLGAGAVNLVLEPVAHPVKTLQGLLPQAPFEPMKQPIPWGKTAADATAAIPGLVLGKLAVPEASAAGEAGAQAATDVASQAKQYIRPASSPSIVPRTEFAARRLSASILPATKDATNFIQAAQQEVPNVLDYAKRTGNPLNTQLEFSKAAQGYAQEVRSLYTDKVLGPVSNNLVRTTGTGFGQRMSEGPDTYATLGEIDNRIGEINKQLDAPTLNADDARRALASKTELQNEASGLRNILHDSLSQSSGLSPDEIANLRQRVGRSYELANDTNAAVTQRQQAQGKADMGPIHMSQLPSRAVELIRGNQVNIADRSFQRAIAQFPGQMQPLPDVQPPVLPTAPVDRMTQLLSKARQQQERLKYIPPSL
jgi:hypothetical protein